MLGFNAYASVDSPLIAADCSFYRFGDELLGKSTLPDNPLRRFLALMRAMNAASYLLEPLEINEELEYERESASLRCNGKVDLTAERLTFFASKPKDKYAYKDPHQLPDAHIIGYAILVTLQL